MKNRYNTAVYFAVAIFMGFVCGYIHSAEIFAVASFVSDVFMNCLKLVSLPIIFLSIVSTAGGMESVSEIKSIGKKVIKYTLLTTFIAAAVALVLYVSIDPVRVQISSTELNGGVTVAKPDYLNHLVHTIPSNFVQPFSENHVIGVLLLAIFLSLAMLSMPKENKVVLHSFFLASIWL